MYVIPTTVSAEIPTPVSMRDTNRLAGFHAKAFSSENPAYHAVVRLSAFLRPTRSENQPASAEPANMPINVAEVRYPITAIGSRQLFMIAGAADDRVLMSPMSKKKMKPRI